VKWDIPLTAEQFHFLTENHKTDLLNPKWRSKALWLDIWYVLWRERFIQATSK